MPIVLFDKTTAADFSIRQLMLCNLLAYDWQLHIGNWLVCRYTRETYGLVFDLSGYVYVLNLQQTILQCYHSYMSLNIVLLLSNLFAVAIKIDIAYILLATSGVGKGKYGCRSLHRPATARVSLTSGMTLYVMPLVGMTYNVKNKTAWKSGDSFKQSCFYRAIFTLVVSFLRDYIYTESIHFYNQGLL